MPDQPSPVNQIAGAIISELDHFQHHFHPEGGALTGPGQYQLLNEPCVGYVVAQKPDGTSGEFFICRHYVPFGYTPSRPAIDYASYLSLMGRIIAKKPGEIHSFEVRDRLGFVLERPPIHAIWLSVASQRPSCTHTNFGAKTNSEPTRKARRSSFTTQTAEGHHREGAYQGRSLFCPTSRPGNSRRSSGRHLPAADNRLHTHHWSPRHRENDRIAEAALPKDQKRVSHGGRVERLDGPSLQRWQELATVQPQRPIESLLEGGNG